MDPMTPHCGGTGPSCTVPTDRGLYLGKVAEVIEAGLGSEHHTELVGSWN